MNRLFKSSLLKHPDRLVIFSPVTFLNEEGFRTHKLLRAIDLNIVITKLKKEDHAQPEEVFYEENFLLKSYENYPQIIENTRQIIDSCSIKLKSDFSNNRQTFTGSRESDFKLLSKLAINGYKRRYGEKNKQAGERVLRELKVIDEMNFSPYFLITWDIVRYAQSAGYHHVGRGSGANSIVAFCLYITDVDPLELDLYFERFINSHRTSPPDFDIDFSWDERDDVTDYIFKRYGKEYTALCWRLTILSKVNRLSGSLGKFLDCRKQRSTPSLTNRWQKKNIMRLAKHIFKFGKLIEGFPNYLSIHAGGVLIAEKPINYFTALQLMPKGFPITHFDMYGAEDLGFHKYDILSQRGLGHIKDTVELVKRNQGKAIDIHDVTKIKQDQKVRDQLRSGQCIGCFYVESPAMRGLLSKLKCDNYVHLVAASSIIRPGVAKSGMMREYIRRFHHPNSFLYLHPIFEKQLGETYGVMVYQEDVLKICHHFAGLDLGESDVLRRIMTGKKKSSDAFAKLRDKYFKNCRERGYSEKLTKEVWRQIESFSGYSFCKAHSASYAVESFQSLYLKAYFPLEFMVGVINNFGGFYYAELYVHEARMQGARIHAPCVNHSFYLTTIEGKDIYLGFIHLHQMERKVAHQIVKERALRGIFKTLEDFISRVDIAQEQLDILIRIGGLRFTGFNKYELMWEKNAVYNPKNRFGRFRSNSSPMVLNLLNCRKFEKAEFDQAFDEIELLGFPLRSPFELIDGKCEGDILARQMNDFVGKKVMILGYYITKKNVTTVNKRLMNFGTWVDKEGRFFDTTHFPPSLKCSPFRGKGCYLIKGSRGAGF